MKTPRYSLIALAAILACRGARGQEEGRALTGVVEDEKAGVLLAAKLTLTNKASGAELKAKLDDEGQFRFKQVAPGDYTLKAKAEGFETVELSVKIRNTEPKPLRIRMRVKSKDEEVTVTSEREPLGLDAGENASALKIDENLLMALPVDGVDVLGALTNFLSPAAQGAMGPSIVVDGMEADAFDVPEWSIKRIRINKNPYSAQFRRPGNARIEVTTRDARDNFHGGITISEHESLFDARNALANRKPGMSKRVFQWRLTGPIRGTRLYYFFNVERVNDKESALVNALTLNGAVNQNIATPTYRSNFLGRIDAHLSQMHLMTVRYVIVDTTQRDRGVGGFRLPEGGYSSGERQSNFEFADHRIATAGFNNDFRIQAAHGENQEGGPAATPAIVVKAAFTSGPSQNFDGESDTTFRVQNVTNYYYEGKHRVQFGGQFRPRWVDTRQQSDFAGVFEFSSLAHFAAGQPYVFRLDQGNPRVSFTQHESFEFIQDQVLLSPNFQLLAGLRHEWHGGVAKQNHLAPRLGLAWSPGAGKKTVLRAGSGLFYETIPKSLLRRSLLFDGVRMRQIVIPNPTYPDPFAGGAALLPQSIVRTDPSLTLPYLFQASAGIEHAISQNVQMSAEYRTLRAVHVFGSRDINAPLPGTLVRPDPAFLNITNVESADTMRSNALELDVRWNAKRFSGMAQYTLSRTYDDADGLFASPANSYNLRPEWGRADYDRRHQFNLIGSTNLPGKVRIGAITTIGSGLPFNITTGEDNNGDTAATDRPPGVTRNTGLGGGLVQVNLRFSKVFEARRLLKKHKKDFNNLELSVDSFNILNHTNYDHFVGVLNSPFYGRANAALAARTVQVSLRYSW